jgi:hypothetical protein
LVRYAKALKEDDHGITLLNSSNSKFCPDFASDKIETFLDPVKGRGIRAIKAMPVGSLILIESPLASSCVDEKDSFSLTLGHDRMMNNKSQSLLESTIMHQMKRNQLLAQRIDILYDGQVSRPLINLKDLLKSIGVANSPLLLPPWSEFFVDKAPPLSAERVRRIISMNSFGDLNEEELLKAISKKGFSKKVSPEAIYTKGNLIYVATSMFNHSFNPNCRIIEHSGSSIAVVTCREVKKGDEMCIRYHHDPEVLIRKWGIEK